MAISPQGNGLVGLSNQGTGLIAGGRTSALLIGDASVFGTLRATSKNFVIDHPLDPANHYLVHAIIESAERVNIYSGHAALDDNGEAIVSRPGWVDALNEEFRYQLTCIGRAGLVYIADEVADGQFRIAGGTAGTQVSWLLTGVRKDAWAKSHPLVVEQFKPQPDRDHYQYPELHGPDWRHSVARLRAPRALDMVSHTATLSTAPTPDTPDRTG